MARPPRYSSSRGPGTLVITAVALVPKILTTIVLDRQGDHAQQLQDGVDHHRLGRALERLRPAAQLGQPLHRVVDPHRQRQEDQPEPVAQLRHLVDRAQVDRHGRPEAQAVRPLAVAVEVAAQPAHHGRGQDVVDRAAQRLARPL